MNNPDQPGYLGHNFDDQPTPLPTHLDWDNLGDGIIGQQPKRRRWPLILFFLLGTVITAGWLVNRSEVNLTGTFPLPVLRAVNEHVAFQRGQATLTNDVANQGMESSTDLPELVANSGSGQRLSQITDQVKIATLDLIIPAKKTAISYPQAPELTNEADVQPATTKKSRVTNQLATPFLMVELEKDLDLKVARSIASTAKKRPNSSRSTTKKTDNVQLVLLVGTGNHIGNIDAGIPLYTSYFSARYRRSISNRWYGSIGLTSRRFVRGSQLNRTEEVNLFRPGTVDTIFRNIDTGSERIVTTDSIAGLRTMAFTGYGRVTLLTLPISIGWRTHALGGELGWEVGVAPGFAVTKSGQVVANNDDVVSTTDQPNWGDRLYLGLNIGVNYSYAITSKLSLQSNIGTSHLVQPQLTAWNFSLGIGYRW